MLNIQRSRAVRIDQEDRFDFFRARGLGDGDGSRVGLRDMMSDDDTIPEAKTRILDWPLSRSTAGLFRFVMSGLLLAGACLAGEHGARAAHPASQQGAIWPGETGLASYYGSRHQGRRTACGERFDQKALTAAHPWLPFGTKVRVTAVATGRSSGGSRRRPATVAAAGNGSIGGRGPASGDRRGGLAEVSLTPA